MLPRNIRSIEHEDEEVDSTQINKNHYVYRLYKNPFITTCTLQKQTLSCILDTGADISLIGRSDLPPGTKIQKSSITLKTADGSPIKILGKTEHIEVVINKKIYKIEFVVSEKELKQVIIGSEIIEKIPNYSDLKMIGMINRFKSSG